MTFFQAIILGVVEGLTEFLPVSSTAHMILVTKWLGLVETEFVKSFIISIQLGATLAVVWLYRARLWQEPKLWRTVLTAFMPTALVGFVFYQIIKSFLFENELIILLALAVGGLVMIIFEYWHKAGNETEILPQKAFVIGWIQALAVIPGVSRAAATIIGGRALGLSRRTAVEFSFFLAIPTMLAATGYDLLKSEGSLSSNDWSLFFIGFVTAFASAILGINFFLTLIERYSFIGFGIYRILIAGLFYLCLTF